MQTSFQEYTAEILESALPKSLLLTVRATDLDTGDFGKVTYKIVGEGSDVFTIHPEEGHIQVSGFLTLIGNPESIIGLLGGFIALLLQLPQMF